MLSSVLSVVLLLLWGDPPAPVPVQHPNGVDEQITVVAELAETPLRETTTHVSLITAAQIETQMAHDVAELLRYEPGVTVQADSTRLGMTGVSIRGIGGNRVSAQIDGVRTVEQFTFGPIATPRSFLDPDLLKSVEVVRGATSSLYGSDALGGVVAFTTKDPSDLIRSGEDHFYRVKSGFSSDDESQFLALTTAHRGQRFDLLAAVTGRSFAEQDNMGENDQLNASRTKPNDLDGSSLDLLLKGVYTWSEGHRLRITAEGYQTNTEADLYSARSTSSNPGGSSRVLSSLADDTNRRSRLSLEDLREDLGLSWLDELKLRLYYQTSETEQDTLERIDSQFGPVQQRISRSGEMTFEEHQVGLGLNAQKWFTIGASSHRLTYGLSLEQRSFSQLRDRDDLDLDTGNPDAYTGTLVFPTRYFPDSTVDELGAYLQWESLFFDERLKLLPGLRYDRTRLDADQADPVYQESTGHTTTPVDLDDRSLSPKFGLRYALTPQLSLNGQYARGFRAPPYSDVNSGFTNLASGYQTLPNPELEPERSENLEFGLRADSSRGAIQLSYFDNQFEDFIDLPFIGVSEQGVALFQARNVDRVAIEGWELSGNLYLLPELRLQASHSHARGHNQAEEVALDSIAPDRSVVGLTYGDMNDRWTSTLNLTLEQDKAQSELSSAELFRGASATLVDLTVQLKLRESWRLFAGGFNLSDETHYNWSSVVGRAATDPLLPRYSEPGRNFRVHLSWHY